MYDATGIKLRKIADNAGIRTTYDYVSGVEYKNTTLERIAHGEGQITRNASGFYEYEYVLRDHLGNLTAVRQAQESPLPMLTTMARSRVQIFAK